jgi:rhamnogalacturonyl hydrolase YesR
LPDNWNETSGTGMFLYLIKRSIEKGYISRKEFDPVTKKAYEGLSGKSNINASGFVDVYDCSSIGIMDSYKMYVSQPKEVNTFAGIASFILGTLSMEGPYK